MGLLTGDRSRPQDAIQVSGDEDPRPECSRIRCPVVIVHGQDDDVIPDTQAKMLADAIPGARVLLTGLYAHTGSSAFDPRGAVEEARTMMGILGAIAGAAAPP